MMPLPRFFADCNDVVNSFSRRGGTLTSSNGGRTTPINPNHLLTS